MTSASALVAVAVLPFLILGIIFVFHLRFNFLQYLNPIGRYVFIAAMIVLAGHLAQSHGYLRRWPRLLPPTSQSNRIALVAGLASTIAMCLLALLIHWSSGGAHDYGAIGGLLPWSDAAAYYEGAEHVIYDGRLTDWNERRPLNALFLAARLIVTGNNFYSALILQALFVAVALFIATSAIWQTHGRTTALLFFSIAFGFIAASLHRTLSEPLGISLGLLALALQWSGIANKNLGEYSLGMFALALALFARAGAMITLLTLTLFAVFFMAENLRQRVLAFISSVAAIGLAWSISEIAIRMYGTGNGALLSNFSYVLYGLSQGGAGWTKAFTDFASVALSTEGLTTAFLYKKSVEAILSDPMLFLWGISKSMAASAAAFPVHLSRLLADGSDGSTLSKQSHVIILGVVLLPLFAGGLFQLFKPERRLYDRFDFFLMLTVVGFAASLPLFYLDGGIRLTAATFPAIAATCALVLAALAAPSRIMDASPVKKYIGIISMSCIAIFLTMSILVPLTGAAMTQPSITSEKKCAAGDEKLSVRIGTGTAHINIAERQSSATIAPNIRRDDFARSYTYEDEWRSLQSPITILKAFDESSKQMLGIIGPVGFADGSMQIKSFCATRLKQSVFTHRIVE